MCTTGLVPANLPVDIDPWATVCADVVSVRGAGCLHSCSLGLARTRVVRDTVRLLKRHWLRVRLLACADCVRTQARSSDCTDHCPERRVHEVVQVPGTVAPLMLTTAGVPVLHRHCRHKVLDCRFFLDLLEEDLLDERS